MLSRHRWLDTGISTGIGVGVAVLLAAAAANAGTKGGMYDMSSMINEGHPFATPSYSRAPATMAPAPVMRPMAPAPVMRPIAPPSPTLRYTPPPRPVAQANSSSSASYNPFGDIVADDWFDRFYIAGGGGLHLQSDMDGATAGASYSIEFDPGFTMHGALGTYLGQDFRIEGELAYRMVDYDQGTAGGATSTPNGDLKMATGMANVYYDVHLGSSFVPFVGGGLGIAQIESTAATIGGVAAAAKDTTEFAYQAIIGVSYEYDRSWSVGLDARYIGTGDEDVSATAITMNVRYSM